MTCNVEEYPLASALVVNINNKLLMDIVIDVSYYRISITVIPHYS